MATERRESGIETLVAGRRRVFEDVQVSGYPLEMDAIFV
jgi:hypothetical protein